MAATSQVFTQLAAQWDTIISTGITASVANAITANATLFASILTLFIIICGCLTMFGRMGMSEWIFAMTRAAIISILLTASAFSTYIQTPLTTTIPNWIAQSVNGGTTTTQPQQFDTLFNQMGVAVGRIDQQLHWTDIGEQIECATISAVTLIELVLMFCIWEFSRGMIGLLVAVAPFLLGFYVFQATRHFVLSLVGQAVTALVTMLLVSIMVALAVSADNAFMVQIATGSGVGAQIQSLLGVTGFFLFSDIIIVMIPALAARIGGGVAHHVGPGRGPASQALNATTRGLTSASAALARAAETITRPPG
ncbi:MAG TPA: type IV secretion system protein [Acetobacteraceae bacterium]|jgi:hypothetical protein|nr:type IV secretion system protein [Acetobacteraceae bacterium]